MNRIVDYMLKSIMRRGRLEVTWADGRKTLYGDLPGRASALAFHTKRAEWHILLNPELRLGELYMSGDISFPIAGGPAAFLHAVEDNWEEIRKFPITKAIGELRFLTRGFRYDNKKSRARANAAHHYDIDERLYRLFLDTDMQYSCAYFGAGVETLDAAQEAKKRHIISKLALEPGLSVLDIGCGWGGMGLALARLGAGRVLGVTLSEEQERIANQRAGAAGLDSAAHFELKDYREVEGSFDRIVSVGMFEHVGVGHYEEFFTHAKRLLKDDGVMLLHSIGRFGPPGSTNQWIEKYIFPGGYIPALSEVLPAIERAGLFVTDIEILRLHYAETLKLWRERFHAHWDEAAKLFDERFCRMWDFYLAGSEISFRAGAMMVAQMQITRRLETLPLTRDYMLDAERRLGERASEPKPKAGAVLPFRSAH